VNLLPLGPSNTTRPPQWTPHADEKPLSVHDEVILHSRELAGLVRGGLRAPDACIAAKLSELESLAASASAGKAVEVKREMRMRLWALRQELDRGPAEGRTPEIRKAFEKLRGLCFDRGMVDAMGSLEDRPSAGRPWRLQRYGVLPCEIPNFERVTTGLLRGGQPDTDGAAWLLADGVRTEVDLRGDDADNAWIAPAWGPVKHYVIPVEDLKPPTFAQVEEFCRVVDDPANQPVYAHCKAGVGRTGAMIACWRITRGESLDDVLAQERLRSYDGSLAQEGFVRQFAAWWGTRDR